MSKEIEKIIILEQMFETYIITKAFASRIYKEPPKQTRKSQQFNNKMGIQNEHSTKSGS